MNIGSRFFAAAASAFALLVGPLQAEVIPGTGFSYGNWEGAAYTNDETGRFSHCVVSARYRSGDTLLLSVTEGASVVIGVSNPSLNLQPGESFPVTVSVDRRARFYARANANTNTTVYLQIDDFQAAMRAIQRGLVMRVDSPRIRGTYSLKGTRRALDRALRCAIDNLQYAAAPRQPAPAPAPAAPVDKTPLYQIATQMITDAGASDFRYLTNAEVDEMGFADGVFWYSAALDTVGGIMLVPAPGGDLRETDANDISFMNGFCKGDFASKAQQVVQHGADQRQLNGYCIEGADRSEFVAVKTRTGQHVLYTVTLYGRRAANAAEQRTNTTQRMTLTAARFQAQR